MRTVSSALLLMVLLGSASAEVSGYKPQEPPAATAQVVKIGFYPVTVHGVDPASNSYYLDTYVWLRWKGEIDPYPTMELTNLIGEPKEKPLNKPEEMPDGTKYHLVRIEGRFVQPFPMERFPLDTQKLSIWVEDSIHGADKLTYVIDREESAIGELVKVPGWEVRGWDAAVYTHQYASQFGAKGGPVLSSKFSAAEFSLQLARPKGFFFWKLLPVLLVVAVGSTALLLDQKLTVVRVLLPAAGLLALLVQMSQQPGVVTLLDKIHLAAALLMVWMLVRVLRRVSA